MRRARISFLAAILALAVVSVASTVRADRKAPDAAGNWPQWRGPQRDGISTETGLLTSWPPGGPAVAWTARGLGAGFSSVSVVGGRIFTMGDRRDGQYVMAVSEDTGKELWATRIGGRHDDEYGGPRG